MIKFAQLQLDMPHTPDIAGQLHHLQLAEDIQEYQELAEHVKKVSTKPSGIRKNNITAIIPLQPTFSHWHSTWYRIRKKKPLPGKSFIKR